MKTFCRLYKCHSDMVFPIKYPSVDLIVTSPPYWQLKDYKQGLAQTGYFDSYEDYHARLNRTWTECKGVLKEGGYLCIVASDLKTTQSSYQVIPINAHIISNVWKMGFVYEGTIIWRKIARNGTVVDPTFPFPRNRYNREEIHIFRKGKDIRRTLNTLTEHHMSAERYGKGWVYTPNPTQKKHPATFPLVIPGDLIEMYSRSGDTVLDPFVGTGTTGVASKELGCNFVGFDNNDTYLTIAAKNLGCKVRQVKDQELSISSIIFDDTHKLEDHRGDLKII